MGLGQVVYDTLVDFAEAVFKAMTGWIKPAVKSELHNAVGNRVFNEDNFMSKEGKAAVTQLKKVWKDSPGDSPDIVADIVDVLVGKAAKVQLQGVTGKTIDKETMPLANALFDQMAIITDLNLIANILGVVGEFVPLFHFDQIGNEIRSYLDYSGLTQITGFGYGMLLSAALAPKITQEIDAKMLNTPLDPRDVINLDYRDELKEGVFHEKMGLKGYTHANADKLADAMRPLPDARTIINLFHRKHIDTDQFWKSMKALGFGMEDIRRLLKAAEYFPTPAEVIVWAAREVFEPEEREKLRLDDKFPEKFWIYAEKAGMTREEAENFWAAHWTFPGWTLIQEMRWRNIITDVDVETFFTEADIVPFWRDAMKEVMYSPYTRVDGRRMYETGILTRDQFKTAMTDIGYTEERAEGLAKWATDRKLAPQKDLTMAKIEKAFRDGEIDAANFTERIIDMGYDVDEATLILNLITRDIEEKEEEENVDWYILRYKNGLITVEELTTFLDSLGLNEAKKNKLILKAKNSKASLAKSASKSDLDKWYVQVIIDKDTYRSRLQAMGYEDNDIDNFVKSIDMTLGGET